MKLLKCDKCEEMINEAVYWHLEISVTKILNLDYSENPNTKSEADYHDRCYKSIREELFHK